MTVFETFSTTARAFIVSLLFPDLVNFYNPIIVVYFFHVINVLLGRTNKTHYGFSFKISY